MTPVWKIDPDQPDPVVIAKAAELIRNGGLVAMPTETVYGLAANALDETAVQRIFTAKGRPSSNPLIVHVESEADVKRVASSVPDLAHKLMAAFWPGPLSIVLPKNSCVPDNVTAGGPTVAVRCPDHVVASALIREAGVPLAAPSANRSNQVSPTMAEHVLKSMNGRIDAILDAGSCRVGIESTVIDLSEEQPRILRPGTLTRPEIEKVVGPISEGALLGIAKSPGLVAKHYSPRTPLFLSDQVNFVDDLYESKLAGKKVGEMGWSWNDPDTYSRNLYDSLHRMDGMGFDMIQAWLPPDEPQWAGVRDRLLRAAKNVHAE